MAQGFRISFSLWLAMFLFGAMAVSHARQSADRSNNVRVEIAFAWAEIGPATLDPGNKVRFPDVENGPGLYRFVLATRAGTSVYIGETMTLHRRLGQYRSPGSRQQTNVRINRALLSTLKGGGQVVVSIAVASSVPDWDLRDKFHRVMLEHAAIARAKASGLTVLNEVVD